MLRLLIAAALFFGVVPGGLLIGVKDWLPIPGLRELYWWGFMLYVILFELIAVFIVIAVRLKVREMEQEEAIAVTETSKEDAVRRLEAESVVIGEKTFTYAHLVVLYSDILTRGVNAKGMFPDTNDRLGVESRTIKDGTSERFVGLLFELGLLERRHEEYQKRVVPWTDAVTSYGQAFDLGKQDESKAYIAKGVRTMYFLTTLGSAVVKALRKNIN